MGDACWWGAVALSDTYKHLLAGAERADSISWNPHKMICVPLQCSVLMVKKKDHLQKMFNKQAKYLFHGESLDMGTRTPQCGRKPDAFKLWLSWKRHGRKGFEKRINHAYKLTEYFAGELKGNPNFLLVAEPSCLNVCFWFIPPSLRGKDVNEIPKEKLAEA